MMTHEEMRREFDGKWVLISDFETDPVSYEILRGRVLTSSVHREVVDAAVANLPKPIHVAVECFRVPGDGTILVL